MTSYLRTTIYTLGYRSIIERNQRTIDNHYRIPYQQARAVFDELKKREEVGKLYDYHDVVMFNVYGQRIHWWLNRGEYFAIGETDGGTEERGDYAAYVIPKDTPLPKPELRLPTWQELGYAHPLY